MFTSVAVDETHLYGDHRLEGLRNRGRTASVGAVTIDLVAASASSTSSGGGASIDASRLR